MSLHLKGVTEITPESAGWTYTGLKIVTLGDSVTVSTGTDEYAILPLAGSGQVETEGSKLALEYPRARSVRALHLFASHAPTAPPKPDSRPTRCVPSARRPPTKVPTPIGCKFLKSSVDVIDEKPRMIPANTRGSTPLLQNLWI